MKIFKLLLYAFSLLILAVVPTACTTQFDEYENDPVWLGSNIYDYLKSDGHYTNYIKLIDDCGYKETMQRTGSVSLFVADDDAFDRFYANNIYGFKSYTDLSKSYKYMMLRSGLLENPYLIESLGSTDTGDKGQILRRTTALKVLDFVPVVNGDSMPSTSYWNRFRGRKFMLLQDGTQWTMLHFTEKVMSSKAIANADFEFITGMSRNAGDAYVFDNKVVKGDMTCKNGYVHKLQNVLFPPQNMAAYIRSNKSVSQYNSLMNRFCAPYFYGMVEDTVTHLRDSVFQMKYFNSGTGVNELTKAPDADGAPKGNVVDGTLMFDPGWNMLQTSSGSGVYGKDMPAMFVPTNEAMAEYFSASGVGNDLYDQFKVWDNVPNSIAADFVSNHMKKSFLSALPSQFATMKDEAGYPMGITTNNIKSSYLTRNGLVYTINKVLPPLDYRTVIGPVKVNSVVSIFQKAQSDAYVKFIYYFRSLLNTYNYFVTLDSKMMNYRDPVSQGFATADRQTWKFKVADNGSLKAVAYNANGDSVTTYGDSRIANRLLDILDQQTIVGKLVDGQEYYITKGGAPIRVNGHVETTANGQQMLSVGSTLEGGGNIERGTKATVVKNYSKENGCTYFIDGIVENPITSVFGALQANPRFSRFLELLAQADLFDSKSGASACLNNKISFFQLFHYTIYVPTNDALDAIIGTDVLPSQTQIDNAATVEEKTALEAKRIKFLRYHFQDNSIFIGGEKITGKKYLSATLNESTGKFYPLYVTNESGSSMTVTDNVGQTANVLKYDGSYNVMARDIVMNKSDLKSSTEITTSSWAVIHLIDKVLKFE